MIVQQFNGYKVHGEKLLLESKDQMTKINAVGDHKSALLDKKVRLGEKKWYKQIDVNNARIVALQAQVQALDQQKQTLVAICEDFMKKLEH